MATVPPGKPNGRKRKKVRRKDDGPLSGRALAAAEKREQAYEMRLQGYTSFRQIGEALGVSAARAYQMIQDEALARRVAFEPRIEAARERALERYEALMTGHMANALKGDPAATGLVLRIMEDMRKLLGLDAPVKVIEKVEGQVNVSGNVNVNHRLVEVRFVKAADGKVIEGMTLPSPQVPGKTVDAGKPAA